MTTKDGTAVRVIHKPLNTPMATPRATAARMATRPGTPARTLSTAITPAANPLRAPTDRSISPISRTRTTPTAMVPVAAIWSVRLVRLAGLMKFSFIDPNTSQMIASAAKTGRKLRSFDLPRPAVTVDLRARSRPVAPAEMAVMRGSVRSG